MNPERVIHWCNMNLHDKIRLACGPWHRVWPSGEDTPPGVHALIDDEGFTVLYTSDQDLATCPDCKGLQ